MLKLAKGDNTMAIAVDGLVSRSTTVYTNTEPNRPYFVRNLISPARRCDDVRRDFFFRLLLIRDSQLQVFATLRISASTCVRAELSPTLLVEGYYNQLEVPPHTQEIPNPFMSVLIQVIEKGNDHMYMNLYSKY